MRTLLFSVLSVVALLAVSGSALAADSSEGDLSEAEEPVEVEGPDRDAAPDTGLPSLRLPPVDALGRPFPDPELLLRARRWTIGGATLTAAGVSIMMTGMLLGSAAVRGQIDVPTEGLYAFAGLLIGGPWLVFAGLPLLSSGNFARGQLTRKIKGVEKVPRTVANEWGYWRAYQQQLFGQTTVITGGAVVVIGVLGMVVAGFSIQSNRYDPRIWAIPATAFSVGAGMLIGGMFLQKAGRAKMEKIRDAVDPFRQSPEQKSSESLETLRPSSLFALLPLPGISVTSDGRGGLIPRGSLSWSLRF